jgi:hypothetical protein
MSNRIEHRVSSPPHPSSPRQGSPWEIAPFRDARGGCRIGLDGVEGWFVLQPEEYERALSLLFGVASAAQRVAADHWKRSGLGAEADYTALTERLVEALHAAHKLEGAEVVVRAIEPTLAVLAAFGEARWTKPPTLKDLIERTLPDLGLRAFKTEIVRAPCWDNPDQWPVVGVVPERALLRVMPKRNAASHQAPSLDDRQLINAGWIVLLAIGHAAATDSNDRWKVYVEDGRVPAERALRGDKDINRTIEMAPPVVVPAPARSLASSSETGAILEPTNVAPLGTVPGGVAASRRVRDSRIVVVVAAVFSFGLAVALAVIPESDPCLHAGAMLPDDVAGWFTGMDLRWAEPAAGFDARCPGYPALDQSCEIYAGRDVTDSIRSSLPGVVLAHVAFDARTSGGMFQVFLRSTASVDAVEALITDRFGAPTSRVDGRPTWDMGEVRVLVHRTPPNIRDATGAQTAVITSYERVSDAYDDLCPL